MLVIDVMFFLLELGVGFAVHSLALMADAFHMVRPLGALGRNGTGADSSSVAQRHHLVARRVVGRLGGEEGHHGQVLLWGECFLVIRTSSRV